MPKQPIFTVMDNPVAAAGEAVAAVTDAAAVSVAVADPTRKALMIRNLGASTCYLGVTNAVTDATAGWVLLPYDGLSLGAWTTTVFAICAAGGACSLRIVTGT